MSDFLYEKGIAPCGVQIETVSGAEEKSAKVWKLFSYQIFSESDGEHYREIEHLENGAPFLDGIPQRISVSHTDHFLVVASLPKTPEADPAEFSVRTAMGVDAERADRRQVLNIKDRFLTAEEAAMLPAVAEAEDADDATVERLIQAWTCKEALYKAAMGDVASWRDDCVIMHFPTIADKMKSATSDKRGSGLIRLKNGEEIEMTLFSWRQDAHIVTVALSTKAARFPSK